LEDRKSKDDKVSRGIQKAVETEAREVRLAEAKERRKKEEKERR